MTIISDKYKCIFVRNPKCASTSIENVFAALDENSVFYSLDEDHIANGHHSHDHIKQFVGEDKWNSYFKFGVVRDPTEWYFSFYLDHAQFNFDATSKIGWALRRNEESRSKHGYDGNIGLNVDLLTSKRLELDPFMQSLTTLMFWHSSNHAYTQTRMLGDELDLIIPIDKIGDGWEKVQKVLGIDTPLGMDNRTPTKGKYEMAEDVSVIHKAVFKNDFQLYNKVVEEYENDVSEILR